MNIFKLAEEKGFEIAWLTAILTSIIFFLGSGEYNIVGILGVTGGIILFWIFIATVLYFIGKLLGGKAGYLRFLKGSSLIITPFFLLAILLFPILLFVSYDAVYTTHLPYTLVCFIVIMLMMILFTGRCIEYYHKLSPFNVILTYILSIIVGILILAIIGIIAWQSFSGGLQT